MIKYLGSIGTFIRLNDNDNKTYQLLNVYSSSAAKLSLFSAEVNNSTGLVSFDSASTSLYVNGVSASIIPNQQWAHITFSFEDKLATYDTNNFLIRFGDTASSNFNIQNLYYMENNLTASAVKYIHQEFTGEKTLKLSVVDSGNSINIIDKQEDNFTSPLTGDIFIGFPGQERFSYDVEVTTTASLSIFTSASLMTGDYTFIDGHRIEFGDKILSLTDNQVYEFTASFQLITQSSSIGDFVRCVFGQEYGDKHFLYTASGFTQIPYAKKLSLILNYEE